MALPGVHRVRAITRVLSAHPPVVSRCHPRSRLLGLTALSSTVVMSSQPLSSAAGSAGHYGDNGILTYGPDDATSLIVFLHGLGDTCHGWDDFVQYIRPRFPNTRFILPTAPHQPVTLNMGMMMPSWYDIKGSGDRDKETCEGIDDSKKIVDDILASEFAKGIAPGSTVVGGFSQGGALSLWTGLQRADTDAPLAGVLCMSGYLPHPAGFALTTTGKQTPVKILHGEADPMVPISAAHKTHSALIDMGVASMDMKTYPDLTHSAHLEEIVDAADFLASVLKIQE